MAARCDVRTDVSVGWWGLGVGPGTRASQISLAPLGWGSRGDGRLGGVKRRRRSREFEGSGERERE